VLRTRYGCDSEKRFRIHYGVSMNVNRKPTVPPIAGWCFVPTGYLVAGDVMLAQKIALETNEFGALAVANTFLPEKNTVQHERASMLIPTIQTGRGAPQVSAQEFRTGQITIFSRPRRSCGQILPHSHVLLIP
jgi:hypothetical protein